MSESGPPILRPSLQNLPVRASLQSIPSLVPSPSAKPSPPAAEPPPRRTRGFGIRMRLVLLISSLGVTVVGLALLLVNARLSAHFSRAAREDAGTAALAMDTSLRASIESYRARAALVADDTLAKEALLKQARELLFTYADSAHDRTKTNILLVLDGKGRVLVDPTGRHAADTAPLGAGWQPGTYAGFARVGGALVALAVVPIEMDHHTIGYLALGDPVTAEALAGAKAVSNADITLIDAAGGADVSTLPAAAARAAASHAHCGEEAREIELDDAPAMLATQPLAGPSGQVACAAITRSLAAQTAEVRDLQRWLLLLGLGVTALAIVGGAVIGYRLLRPIRSLTAAVHKIARGDLSQQPIPVRSDDELGQLASGFNDMLAALRELARVADRMANGDLPAHAALEGQVGETFNRMLQIQRDVITELGQASYQLAGAAAEIYAATQQQEGSVAHQKIGAEEISRTMQSLLESAANIAETARSVLASAEQSRETTEQMAARLAELGAHSGRIAEILDVIREIAERSDLLALNASLESARAGEAGRPFALVAAEMRRLAERVTGSVADVRDIVANIRASSAAAGQATTAGKKLADGTTENARLITRVTQQQQTATDQVLQSMHHIGAVLSESAAATQQTLSSAEILKSEADRLRALVGRFSTEKPA